MNRGRPLTAVALGIAIMLLAIADAALTPDAAAAARVPRCNGLDATIVAPAGGGLVEGTAGDDVIYGSGRADVIIGNGGNDTICGRGGNDIIYAGVPRDDVDPTACVRVREDDATPVVYIHGGSGDDLICGPNATNSGFWEVDGGSGNDLIGWASGVSELIAGGSGNDTIVGTAIGEAAGPLTSRISGGSGADAITIAPVAADDVAGVTLDIEADGGEGRDSILATARASVSGELSGGPGLDSCMLEIVDEPVAVTMDDTCEA